MKVEINWSGVVLSPENDDDKTILMHLAMALAEGGQDIDSESVWYDPATRKISFIIG